MAKQTTDDKLWEQRIDLGDKFFKSWESLFKCKYLAEYYEGFQWAEQDEQYVINKVYETVQIKIDEYIPQFPQFKLGPKPGSSDFDLDTAVLQTQLKQDVLNTIIGNDKMHFQSELKDTYKDHFFYFGVYEVGYEADWIFNPNSQKALTDKDVDVQGSGRRDVKVLKEPDLLPVRERVYIKHIPARTFRIFGQDHKYLNQCDSFGYYEYVHKEDVLSLKKLLNREKVVNAGTVVNHKNEEGIQAGNEQDYHLLKIWHIWDLKARERLVLLDDPCVTIFVKKLDRINVFDYRPDHRVTNPGFYPIPPVFHWLSPQNEINETREQLKKHRRRFTRKFQIFGEMIDDVELEKFESGDDGVLVKVKAQNAIVPIQDAPLGPAISQAIATSADDLNQISGTSNQERQVADRTTATESTIINQRAAVRTVAEQARVNEWICKGGREILLIARDYFVLGIWAEITADSKETLFGEVQENQPAYKYVTTEDLKDGYDFKIEIELSSMSVSAQQQEKQNFVEFLALVSQYPQIAMSPVLVRETALRTGYRNEKVIKEMQKMALVAQAGVMNQVPGLQGMAPGAQQQNAQQPGLTAQEQVKANVSRPPGIQ